MELPLELVLNIFLGEVVVLRCFGPEKQVSVALHQLTLADGIVRPEVGHIDCFGLEGSHIDMHLCGLGTLLTRLEREGEGVVAWFTCGRSADSWCFPPRRVGLCRGNLRI